MKKVDPHATRPRGQEQRRPVQKRSVKGPAFGELLARKRIEQAWQQGERQAAGVRQERDLGERLRTGRRVDGEQDRAAVGERMADLAVGDRRMAARAAAHLARGEARQAQVFRESRAADQAGQGGQSELPPAEDHRDRGASPDRLLRAGHYAALHRPVAEAPAAETVAPRLPDAALREMVERVRVGADAAGRATFEVDLRTEVLAGATLRVTAEGGRVRAVFYSGKPQVRRLLAGSRGRLAAMLAARGLRLEELEIVERS